MSTILVTGATGTVGAHVVRELRALGEPVRAFVRDPDRASAALGPEVELAVGDFGDPASVAAALAGADRVFLASPNHPQQVMWEAGVIEAAADAGVGRIVKLSACGAEPGSPLDFWDAQGRIEAHLRGAGVPAVVLQPTTYMGLVLASADSIRDAGAIFAPAADAKLAWTDPRDVAAVAAAALTQDGHDGRTHVVTGPALLGFAEVAAEVSAVAGRPVAYVPVPDDAARAAMIQAGLPEWVAGNLVTLFQQLRGGAAALTTGTVHALTGRDPTDPVGVPGRARPGVQVTPGHPLWPPGSSRGLTVSRSTGCPVRAATAS